MKQFICRNPDCGFNGAPARRVTGSWLTMLMLMSVLPLGLLMISPLAAGVSFNAGVLYVFSREDYRYGCPKCGTIVARS